MGPIWQHIICHLTRRRPPRTNNVQWYSLSVCFAFIIFLAPISTEKFQICLPSRDLPQTFNWQESHPKLAQNLLVVCPRVTEERGRNVTGLLAHKFGGQWAALQLAERWRKREGEGKRGESLTARRHSLEAWLQLTG